jgi:serine/threonine-protein kinase
LEQDAVAAGLEQRVDAVIDGQIQKSGEKMRVSARLVRVNDGATLWSSQFDEKATDIFAVQDSISQRVAGMLVVKLTGDEQRQLAKRHTGSTEAYQLYMVGRLHYGKRTRDGAHKAIEYFKQAIEKDPNYALAHAALAAAYSMSGWYGYLGPHEAYTKARESAIRALQMDDALPEAHVVLGSIKRNYDWDWVGAESEFSRALELDPNNAAAYHSRGVGLAYVFGRFDESMASLKRAQELDPVSLNINTTLGDTFLLSRRYDEAIEQYKKVLDLDSSFAEAHSFLGEAYFHKNMHREAVAELLKGEAASGRSAEDIAALRTAHEKSGIRGYWQELIVMKKRSSEGHTSPFDIAFLYSGLGDRDHAFEWLERAYQEHDPALVLLNRDPMFDSLRSDPRFTDLLRRLGLPQ